MPAPVSIDDLLDLVRKSGVTEEKRLYAYVRQLRETNALPSEPAKLAALLVRDGLLTNFQSEQLLQGKWRRFTIGKYKVLERLGSGGMGSVFLCEHKFMRQRVAVKVLPTVKAADPSSLERFYREAKAAGAVNHPNLVRATDIDQDETLHFIVMEYVDGASLQDIVRKSGPLSLERACHYVSQAAQGLDHASRAGLVHRDIKPGNVLVDRLGTVKILDMGLARFFNDDEDMLTRKYDENVLGTADYLAPEQADDSHAVDVRADIYSLGGTFYFLLTGRTPFGDGSVPQKLMWHRTRQPKPISAYRTDVPPAVQSILDKMMAKEPGQRYQQAAEISEALAPWTQAAVPPPGDDEMPRLSPALAAGGSPGSPPTMIASGSPSSAATRKAWQVTGTAASKSPSTELRASTELPASKPAPNPADHMPATQKIKFKAPRPAVAKPGPVASLPGAKKKEDDSSLVDVAPDTADPAARGDTPPQTPSKSKPQKLPAVTPKKMPRQTKLLVLAAAAALIVFGLAVLVAATLLLGVFGRRTEVRHQPTAAVLCPAVGHFLVLHQFDGNQDVLAPDGLSR